MKCRGYMAKRKRLKSWDEAATSNTWVSANEVFREAMAQWHGELVCSTDVTLTHGTGKT